MATTTRTVNLCSACGQSGHRSDSKKCPKFGQAQAACTYCKRTNGTHSAGCIRKAATGGRKPSKPAPRPAVAAERRPSANGVAAHIRQLYADVERGKVAEAELADVKKALAGI